jgi:hypothetical protein
LRPLLLVSMDNEDDMPYNLRQPPFVEVLFPFIQSDKHIILVEQVGYGLHILRAIAIELRTRANNATLPVQNLNIVVNVAVPVLLVDSHIGNIILDHL